MSNFEPLKDKVRRGDKAGAETEVETLLKAGAEAQGILDHGLIAAMDEVGEAFAKGKIFVPQMLRSAKTMQDCLNILRPRFGSDPVATKGKLLIGTVKGDLHDIGKNLVSMMMESAGFEVTDLGVDANPEKFVKNAQEMEPDIVGMSALVATTMPAMRETIAALKAAGLREKVKVIIGGAPVTEKFAREIGADVYAPDAGSAVLAVKKILGTP